MSVWINVMIWFRSNMLEELRPKFVILYGPSLEVIRHLEVYKALHPGVFLRVYFLM